MDTPRKEFSLEQLLDEPAVGIALEHEGLDRRSLELLRELTFRLPRRESRLPHAPFVC